MSFSIQLGKVNKARNSTKVPTLGSTVSVYLKDDTSIIRPVWRLRLGVSGAPSFSEISQMNYCYCANFKRYYFITNVTMETASVALIACEVDVLATFRSDILETPAFVMFSQSRYNSMIPDTRLPAIAQSTQSCVLSNMPFCDEEGVFTVTAVSPNNTGDNGVAATVAVNLGSLKQIASKLYSEDFWEGIKIDIYKPEEALLACMWTPINSTAAIDTSGSTTIKIGRFDLGTFYNARKQVLGTAFVAFNIPYQDIESGNIGDYRNFEPYTRYMMYLPGVGNIEIPMKMFAGMSGTLQGTLSIPVRMVASPLTGDIVYNIGLPDCLGGIEGQAIGITVKGNFGVEVPISRTVGRYGNVVQAVTGALSGATLGAVQGGLVGAAIGAVGAGVGAYIGDAIRGDNFNTSMSGMLNGWSVSHLHNEKIEAKTINWQVSDSPNNIRSTIGRPLYKYVSSLGSLNGYVQCTGAYVKTWATNEELAMISRYVNSASGDGGIIIE